MINPLSMITLAATAAGNSAAKNEASGTCATAKVKVAEDFAYTISDTGEHSDVVLKVKLSENESYSVGISREKADERGSLGNIPLFTIDEGGGKYISIWVQDKGFVIDVNGETRFHVTPDGKYSVVGKKDIPEEVLKDALAKISKVISAMSNKPARFKAISNEFGNVRASEIEKETGKYFTGKEVLALKDQMKTLAANKDLVKVSKSPIGMYDPEDTICIDSNRFVIDSFPAPTQVSELKLTEGSRVKFSYIKDDSSAMLTSFEFKYLSGPKAGETIRFAYDDCKAGPQIGKIRLIKNGENANDKTTATELIWLIENTGRENIIAPDVMGYLNTNIEMLRYIYNL